MQGGLKWGLAGNQKKRATCEFTSLSDLRLAALRTEGWEACVYVVKRPGSLTDSGHREWKLDPRSEPGQQGEYQQCCDLSLVSTSSSHRHSGNGIPQELQKQIRK